MEILEQRIQKVADLEDIKGLMAKYCHGIDKKNEALFMSIWDEDGVLLKSFCLHII